MLEPTSEHSSELAPPAELDLLVALELLRLSVGGSSAIRAIRQAEQHGNAQGEGAAWLENRMDPPPPWNSRQGAAAAAKLTSSGLSSHWSLAAPPAIRR
eukprot:SAG31_NODE_2198_length_6212_cov_3.843096_10_plen_98_part_01